MFDDVTINVLLANHTSFDFQSTTGVLQGPVLSPHPYSIYINTLPSALRAAATDTCPRVGDPPLPINSLLFADDVAILGNPAEVQDEAWAAKFLQDPNAFALECDVLIVTSVLQAGHSLDRHFQTSYDFRFLDVLTFREELQFVSRLRFLGRTDISGRKHAWIQPAKSNRTIASIRRLKSAMMEIADTAIGVPAFLAGIMAAVRSEAADTSNRHVHLWHAEYLLANVNIHYVDEVAAAGSGVYDRKWIKDIMQRYLTNSTQVTQTEKKINHSNRHVTNIEFLVAV